MAATICKNIEALKKKIGRKWVLLDTNIIIEGFQNPDEFIEFHKELVEAACAPVYIPMIEFEFLRGAFDPKIKAKRKEFLEEVAQKYPTRSDSGLTESAIEIANAYEARKGPKPELVDCHVAALLRMFPGRLFLATLNHQDYPTFLFNPLYVFPVVTKKRLLTVGIYEWDLNGAKEAGL